MNDLQTRAWKQARDYMQKVEKSISTIALPPDTLIHVYGIVQVATTIDGKPTVTTVPLNTNKGVMPRQFIALLRNHLDSMEQALQR
jgi:hypothetical protein